MWYIAVLIILFIVSLLFIHQSSKDRFRPSEYFLIGALFSLSGILLLSVITFYPVVAATTGLLPNYSKGERIGFITKISYEGVIWKTNELQMQVGTGNMAALQEPHPFSCSAEVATQIKEHIGQKVKIHYTEWSIMPFRKGESGYWVDRIEWLEEVEEE